MSNIEKYRQYFTKDCLTGPNSFLLPEDLAAGNTVDGIEYAWYGNISKAHPYQPNDRRIVYKI